MYHFNVKDIDQPKKKYKTRNINTIGLIRDPVNKRKQLPDKVDINPTPR